MFEANHRVGRLVELRVESPLKPEEVVALREKHMKNVLAIPGPFVAVTDLRKAYVFPQAIVEGFMQMLQRANPKLERSAILISDSATFSLQVGRILEEVGNPDRRTFHSPFELQAWLGEVLDRDERRRLRDFLEGPAPGRA